MVHEYTFLLVLSDIHFSRYVLNFFGWISHYLLQSKHLIHIT